MKARLLGLIEVLFGCSHGKTTLPLTPRNGESAYVVCLDCGREFTYDWKTMQLGRERGVSG